MRSRDLGGRIIKVDHAGEHGAINIYTGQIFIARWTAPALLEGLSEFLAHEKRHRQIFADELRRRGIRRWQPRSPSSASCLGIFGSSWLSLRRTTLTPCGRFPQSSKTNSSITIGRRCMPGRAHSGRECSCQPLPLQPKR